MGLPFAILRPVAALFTALFGGLMVNKFAGGEKTAEASCKEEVSLKEQFREIIGRGWGRNLWGVLKYAFFDMMQDIGRWLVIGLVVAGLITVFVPDTFFITFQGNTLLSIALVLVFAIPMYLCATGSIPIAVALMLKGLSPGAALVLLMAGPASNAASMLVVSKVLGKRTMIIYLLSIIGGATLFALGIDYLMPDEWFTAPLKQLHLCCTEGSSAFNIGATIVLALLLINALVHRFIGKRKEEGECGCSTGECGCQCSKTVYSIEGMSCNHCRTNVEKAIGQVAGVESVSVDLALATATVTGHASKEDIRQAVEKIGFKVKDI
jgi:copper chaperone CopZ